MWAFSEVSCNEEGNATLSCKRGSYRSLGLYSPERPENGASLSSTPFTEVERALGSGLKLYRRRRHVMVAKALLTHLD